MDYNIIYIRKSVWCLISKLSLYKFEKENMIRMKQKEVQEVVAKYNIPIAKLRILPKKNTFRPLMTFFRKSGVNYEGSKKLSMNKILVDTHVVLRNLKDELHEKMGFSVFDNYQIGKKYENFVREWNMADNPKLYFMTMDIRKCYDSIDKNRLLSLIENSDILVIF